MAGQDIESGPREPTWHIKVRGGSESLFKKCPTCGQRHAEPSYSVIRVKDEQYKEWQEMRNKGVEYGAGFVLAFIAAVAVFLLTVYLGTRVVKPVAFEWGFELLFLSAVGLAILTYLVLHLRMARYNDKVRAERLQRKVDFLKQFGGMSPDEVSTPDYGGGSNVKYMLLPEDIYEELSYDNYLEGT